MFFFSKKESGISNGTKKVQKKFKHLDHQRALNFLKNCGFNSKDLNEIWLNQPGDFRKLLKNQCMKYKADYDGFYI